MTVKHSNDVEAKNVAAGKDTTIQVLISAQEGPNFALRNFSMQKGGGMPSSNEHSWNMRSICVLRGEATITIGDETHHVKQAMYVLHPRAARCISYENTGAENRLSFCALVPNNGR